MSISISSSSPPKDRPPTFSTFYSCTSVYNKKVKNWKYIWIPLCIFHNLCIFLCQDVCMFLGNALPPRDTIFICINKIYITKHRYKEDSNDPRVFMTHSHQHETIINHRPISIKLKPKTSILPLFPNAFYRWSYVVLCHLKCLRDRNLALSH
jgi:hypothetical protein